MNWDRKYKGSGFKMSLREKKAAKKKEEMIKSAVSIIAEKGYHSTTMEEIASKLLMTKGSVYYYFKDKQDLLYQGQKMLLEQSIENIEGIINQSQLSITEKLEKTMIEHIEYLITERTGFAMGANPEQFFAGEQLEIIIHLRYQYSKCVDELLIEGIEAGFFATLDIKIVRNIILGAMNWVVEWYSPEGEKDKTQLAQSISNYLLRMLIKEERKISDETK